MELQVCEYCGWSSMTTYHGLRIHQGRMGCTSQGMRIPQSQPFGFDYNLHDFDISSPSMMARERSLRSRPAVSTPAKNEKITTSDTSLHVCHCGSKFSSYQGLRIHQGRMGCTPKGMRIPEKETDKKDSRPAVSTTVKNKPDPISSKVNPAVRKMDVSLFQTPHSSKATNAPMYQRLVGGAQQGQQFQNQQTQVDPVNQVWAPPTATTQEAAAQLREAEREKERELERERERERELEREKERELERERERERELEREREKERELERERERELERERERERELEREREREREREKERELEREREKERELEREREREKERELEREKERELEREKEREAQKLQKAKQDKIRAEFQEKIQMGEQKVDEIRSAEKACNDSLDAEIQEINSVFAEVMRAVEDTHKKALQPLEERRHRLQREAQALVQKLQKEVDKLKLTIDEFDKNPDLQGVPLTGLDESRDWKNITVNTSSSRDTLRTKTSNMMEQIQQKLEKLSPVGPGQKNYAMKKVRGKKAAAVALQGSPAGAAGPAPAPGQRALTPVGQDLMSLLQLQLDMERQKVEMLKERVEELKKDKLFLQDELRARMLRSHLEPSMSNTSNTISSEDDV